MPFWRLPTIHPRSALVTKWPPLVRACATAACRCPAAVLGVPTVGGVDDARLWRRSWKSLFSESNHRFIRLTCSEEFFSRGSGTSGLVCIENRLHSREGSLRDLSCKRLEERRDIEGVGGSPVAPTAVARSSCRWTAAGGGLLRTARDCDTLRLHPIGRHFLRPSDRTLDVLSTRIEEHAVLHRLVLPTAFSLCMVLRPSLLLVSRALAPLLLDWMSV